MSVNRKVTVPVGRAGAGGADSAGPADGGLAVLGVSDACIATYPGDWGTALAAFDASVETTSSRGSRTISIHDLHVEPGQHPEIETILEPDELIVGITVPRLPVAAGEDPFFPVVAMLTTVAIDPEETP